MKYKVGVVVPILSQFQLAIEALNSIRTKYDWEPCIVDNWRTNRGVAAAWNLGATSMINRGCSHILVINDDIVIAPGAIDQLIEHWPEDYALLSCSNYNDISNLPDDPTVDEHPDFSCFMIKPETIDNIGLFDENFKKGYFEDNDYHYRIKLAGYKAGKYHNAAHHHYGSRTQNNDITNPIVSGEEFDNNKRYYYSKWGGYPTEEIWTEPFNGENK